MLQVKVCVAFALSTTEFGVMASAVPALPAPPFGVPGLPAFDAPAPAFDAPAPPPLPFDAPALPFDAPAPAFDAPALPFDAPALSFDLPAPPAFAEDSGSPSAPFGSLGLLAQAHRRAKQVATTIGFLTKTSLC